MKILFGAIAGASLSLGLWAAPAEPQPLLPVETFFRKPAYASLSFSPDGKSLAMLQSTEGRMNIVVVDLEKMTKTLLTNYREQDVGGYAWVSGNRIAFGVDTEGNEFFGLYIVGRDGKDYRELAGNAEARLRRGKLKLNPRTLGLFSRIKGEEDYYLVLSNERFIEFPDVYRINLLNGNKVMTVTNPGNVTGWVADRDGVVRLGITQEPGQTGIHYRDHDGQPWVKLATFGFTEPGWIPLGFDGDNRTLFVLSDLGRPTQAVLRYDTKERKFSEPVLADSTYDADGLIFSRAKNRVIGLTMHTAKSGTHWLDPQFTEYQRIVDQALPGMENQIREATPDGKKLIVFSSSDREPGVYYLMDLEKRGISELAVLRDWIDPEKMAPMRPVEIAARDGLKLHGYLTLPLGREPKRLPLVLLPHGGPFGIRDGWGFDPEVQFLANRGFAVLQVNYRGSGGYGRAFQAAGYRRWGREMQHDLSDGVKWAVTEGYADPKRIVIQGGSYGGYAVMAGLAFTPELYCAGINVAGVTDLVILFDGASRWSDARRAIFTAMIADPKYDRDMVAAVSPVNHAGQIRAPVFMAYGENDPRVDIEHAYRMERALKRANRPVEFFLKHDEGHGFRKEENAIELYKRIDSFLKAHVPR